MTVRKTTTSDKQIKIVYVLEKPTLDQAKIIRVCSSDQRKTLVAKIKSVGNTKCSYCRAREWRFGYVFVQGSKNHVTGITYECQKCEHVWTAYFEPMDSMTLKVVELPMKRPEDDMCGK